MRATRRERYSRFSGCKTCRDVRVGSKPVKLNASRCFPLCRQKRTLPASATIFPGADLSCIRCATPCAFH
jgi:hypothetical protein